MLIPLKKEIGEEIIPLIATANQYAYYWRSLQNILKNLFLSLVGVVIIWLVCIVLGRAFQGLSLVLRLIAGLYWLWGPVYWASVKNGDYRRYPYVAFWRGRISDIYITEELINEQQMLNKLGDLIIIENREKKINLEVEDQTGFRTNIQAPLQRIYKTINRGQAVEALLLSNDPDFRKIAKITDVYIPRHQLWVGEYPYLRRDIFLDVRRELARIYASPPH
jgi:hypothetical protein